MVNNSSVQALEKKTKVLFTVKFLPIFMGLSNDLLFYIAINTLFLTYIKSLSASQITFLVSISGIIYIVLQKPFLKIIKRIGNIKSVRLGTIMLLLASILLTFSKKYLLIILGEIIYVVSFLFKSMDNVILKNNLVFLNKQDKYIKYKNKSNIIFAINTTIITLLAGYLYQIDCFLPMYLCILLSIFNVFFSYLLVEVECKEETSDEKLSNERIKFRKTILLILIAYAIFYAIISTGKTNIKLLMEHELEIFFGLGKTAIYFSYVLVISQISRVIANMLFYKVYKKIKDKVLYYLPIVCLIAFLLVIVGSIIQLVICRIILILIGLCLVFSIKDIFSTYIHDLVLKKARLHERQECISYLGLSKKIGEISISLIISLLLLKLDLLYIIFVSLLLSLISYIINLEIYTFIIREDEKK